MPTSGPEAEPDAVPSPAAGAVTPAADDLAAITGFVRGTLACTCPDQVFEHIHVSRPRPRQVRLDIGGRLLVHVVRGVVPDVLTAELPGWVRDGIAERRRLGMNRFRLVLGSGEPAALRTLAEPLFAHLSGGDDRAHLHCLHESLLHGLPGAAGH